ncbi:hypothetical protein K0M31_019066 [Melipona bicolor]|uniref:Uncharacterized protein n=1 Tax=Melipona bicolor TaxID=60889 RepID=A0AA40FCS3_9HYME|nr:hypothetical protein K0M31_019066 [Melipona bicolor]
MLLNVFRAYSNTKAEEGLVSRELSASPKSRIRGVGATTARHVGRTREPGEGQLRDKYRTLRKRSLEGLYDNLAELPREIRLISP